MMHSAKCCDGVPAGSRCRRQACAASCEALDSLTSCEVSMCVQRYGLPALEQAIAAEPPVEAEAPVVAEAPTPAASLAPEGVLDLAPSPAAVLETDNGTSTEAPKAAPPIPEGASRSFVSTTPATNIYCC